MMGQRSLKARRPWSIRTRLLTLLLVPLTGVAVLVAVETYFSARRTANELHDRTLLAVLLAVRENIVASDGEILTEDTLEVLTEKLGDQFFYHVAWPGNGFVTGYASRPLPREGESIDPGSPRFYDASYAGSPVRAVVLRQFAAEGTPAALNARVDGWLRVTVWQHVRQRDALALDLFTRSVLRLLAILGAAGLIVFLAVTRGLQPLDALRSAIERRSPTELSPIRRSVAPELRGIVGAMNDLLARVERSRVNRERFIADAAHQLRNPLAAIKTEAQVGLSVPGIAPEAERDASASSARTPSRSVAGLHDETNHSRRSLSAIVETTDRTAAMVEQMLTGARANAMRLNRDDRSARIDLVAMARSVTLSLADKALAAGHTLSFDERRTDGERNADEPFLVLAEEALLHEALANLVDNAIVHNPPGTAIEVSIEQNDDRAVVEVRDDGTAMPSATFTRLSQPFATGGTQTEGSGLGLSITKDIVRSHGGDLTLLDGAETGGRSHGEGEHGKEKGHGRGEPDQTPRPDKILRPTKTFRLTLPRAQTPPHARGPSVKPFVS